MIPPIRCFTCGKVIADKYDYYVQEMLKLEKKDEAGPSTKVSKKKQQEAHELRHFDGVFTKPIMDKLGLTRYCCRRMMLGVEDMMDKI